MTAATADPATAKPTSLAHPDPYTEDEVRDALIADLKTIVPDQIVLDAETFDVTRHDGTVTITNEATKKHRVFRVKTARSGNLKGKRVVSLLIANTYNAMLDRWEGFAFADEFGVHGKIARESPDLSMGRNRVEFP
jgi:hypothetical protein